MVWKLFMWSSLRKSYSICLENSDLAKLWPFKTKIWPFFGKNWLFWEFLTYDFQTQLWIILIFGMELLWISTLSGEPIILCLVGSKIHCSWWQNGVFGGFWPISSNLLMLYGQVLLYEQYLFLWVNEFEILPKNFLARFGPFFG